MQVYDSVKTSFEEEELYTGKQVVDQVKRIMREKTLEIISTIPQSTDQSNSKKSDVTDFHSQAHTNADNTRHYEQSQSNSSQKRNRTTNSLNQVEDTQRVEPPPISKVQVSAPIRKTEGISSFLEYPIYITLSNGSSCQSAHRYSDFEAFFSCLAAMFPGSILPSLPPKESLAFSGVNDQFLHRF